MDLNIDLNMVLNMVNKWKSPYLEPYFEAPIFHGVKLELQSINGPSIYCEGQISIYATADVTQLRSPVYQLTQACSHCRVRLL